MIDLVNEQKQTTKTNRDERDAIGYFNPDNPGIPVIFLSERVWLCE